MAYRASPLSAWSNSVMGDMRAPRTTLPPRLFWYSSSFSAWPRSSCRRIEGVSGKRKKKNIGKEKRQNSSLTSLSSLKYWANPGRPTLSRSKKAYMEWYR